MVRKLSHEKFPLSTNQACVSTMIAPAIDATGCGANRKNGTTSWAKKLPSTSMRWSGLGRWWKNQLRLLGIGCVSWW